SRRRHTRSYGDWSSDVCSSDLTAGQMVRVRTVYAAGGCCSTIPLSGRSATEVVLAINVWHLPGQNQRLPLPPESGANDRHRPVKIGRASCRERVYISVVAGC